MATSRVSATTINKYFKTKERPVMRRRRFTALLKEKGRVTTGHSGLACTWPIDYKRVELIAPGPGNFTVDFPAHNTYKQATVPWKIYVMTEGINKMERLQNAGSEAIIKIFSSLLKDRMDDANDNFNEKLYLDGLATGNQSEIWGLNTWFGVSGASTKAPVGLPNDTYAGVPTDLAGLGGSWDLDGGTSIWPFGRGKAHYDAWSPKVIDITSTVSGAYGWAASTKTWPNTCMEAIHLGTQVTQRDGDELDVIILEMDMWNALRKAVEAKEQINTQRSATNSLLINLGFKNVINVDGVDVTWEQGPPIENGYGTGYGLVIDKLELMSMQSQLFHTDDDYDLAGSNERFLIDFYGQFRCKSPKYSVKFRKIT